MIDARETRDSYRDSGVELTDSGVESLFDFLESAAFRYGARPALIVKPRYRDEVWTYRRLLDESIRVAGLLRGRGVDRGDRVILWAPNSPLWVAVYFASARLGSILVPLDIRSNAEFVDLVVQQTAPRLAILSPGTAASWTQTTPSCSIDDLSGTSGINATGGVTEDTSAPDAPRTNANEIAEILFTSGTTGDPKACYSRMATSHQTRAMLTPYFLG